jgi:hypothetical protein
MVFMETFEPDRKGIRGVNSSYFYFWLLKSSQKNDHSTEY